MIKDEPLEESDIDKLELDPEAVEAAFGDHSMKHEITAKSIKRLDSAFKKLEKRLTELEPLATDLGQSPLLWDRITGDGPFIDVTDETDYTKDGYRYYYSGHMLPKETHRQSCRYLWPRTLTTKNPNPTTGLNKTPQKDLDLLIKEAREDGRRQGFANGRRKDDIAFKVVIVTLLTTLAIFIFGVISTQSQLFQ